MTAAVSDDAVSERFEAAALPAAVHQGSGAITFRPRRVGRDCTSGSAGEGEDAVKCRDRLCFELFRAAPGRERDQGRFLRSGCVRMYTRVHTGEHERASRVCVCVRM